MRRARQGRSQRECDKHGRVDEGAQSGTHLAGVDKLGPDDPPRNDVDVGVVEDDGRALAAELERDGREVLGGRLGDDAADAARARVEDVVVAELEERCRLRDGAQDADEGRRVEVLGEERRDEGGRRRTLLGGLQVFARVSLRTLCSSRARERARNAP